MTIPALLGYLASIMVVASLIRLLTQWGVMHRRKPLVEGTILGRLFQLVAMLAVVLTPAFDIEKLSTVGQFFIIAWRVDPLFSRCGAAAHAREETNGKATGLGGGRNGIRGAVR